MPSINPETTIESEEARLSGGAKSPTSGNMICGVTVVMAVMNEIPVKVAKEVVTQSPILDTNTQANQLSCPIEN